MYYSTSDVLSLSLSLCLICLSFLLCKAWVFKHVRPVRRDVFTLHTSCSQAHDLQEHLIIQLRQIGAFNLACDHVACAERMGILDTQNPRSKMPTYPNMTMKIVSRIVQVIPSQFVAFHTSIAQLIIAQAMPVSEVFEISSIFRLGGIATVSAMGCPKTRWHASRRTLLSDICQW